MKKIYLQSLSLISSMLLVMSITLPIDIMLNSLITFFGIVWINIGLATIRIKKIILPMPDGSRIDVIGGFRILWWALFWPKYVLRNKRR